MKSLRILSPAKINLHLRVGPRAADGFHPLLSWMCTVGLCDAIEMTASGKPSLRLTCDRPDVPVDATNLILRAGNALKKDDAGAEVMLRKKIPLGGGLGGGSSNAAFALRGLNELWNLNHSDDYLAKIGARLGSDVPFFLGGSSSVCAGRGERTLPIARPRPKCALLILPPFPISTAEVYQKFDEMNLGSTNAITRQPDWNAWTRLSAEELMNVLVNDLEAPAFSLRPELAELRRRIEQKIGRAVRMTGSGSTLFSLMDEPGEAEQAIQKIRREPADTQCFDLTPDLTRISSALSAVHSSCQ